MTRLRKNLAFCPGLVALAGAALGGDMDPNVTLWNFRATDAEYSSALDRIVAVASPPDNELHVVDPDVTFRPTTPWGLRRLAG